MARRFLRRLAHLTLRLARALSARERIGALLALATVASGSAWGIASLVRSTTTVVPASGGVLRLGAVGQPRFVLPILAQTNDTDMDLSRLLYRGLLAVNERGELTGDLAARYVVSDDGKTYTVHLRDDSRWHDGAPVTTEDVLLTISLIQDPAVKSPLAPSFQGVSVTKVDDRTLRFSLREPYAPFPYTLTVGILPSHLWADLPPAGIALAEHALRPVGSGSFRFERLKRAELSGEIYEYRLTRADGETGTPRPYLDDLIFKFSPTAEDLLRALRRGEVDGASSVPPAQAREVSGLPGIRLARVRLPHVFAVFFHQAKNHALANPAVRRALAAAVDRERLITEALHGEGAPVVGPLPLDSLGYTTDLPVATRDVANARQNLAEAGWTDTDGDGIRDKEGVALRFTLATTESPEYVATANLLRDQWREIGVDVTVQPATTGTMQAEILRPRNYEALLYGQVLGLDPDPYPFWHSTQTRDPGLNLALFKDQTADQLLERARQTTDAGVRAATYRKFQERLAEEVPAVFLFSPTYAYALPDRVRGTFLETAPLPADRFAAVHTWYMKTQRVRGTSAESGLGGG